MRDEPDARPRERRPADARYDAAGPAGRSRAAYDDAEGRERSPSRGAYDADDRRDRRRPRPPRDEAQGRPRDPGRIIPFGDERDARDGRDMGAPPRRSQSRPDHGDRPARLRERGRTPRPARADSPAEASRREEPLRGPAGAGRGGERLLRHRSSDEWGERETSGGARDPGRSRRSREPQGDEWDEPRHWTDRFRSRRARDQDEWDEPRRWSDRFRAHRADEDDQWDALDPRGRPDARPGRSARSAASASDDVRAGQDGMDEATGPAGSHRRST
ncbi:MAG TPA: hypothetical protein VIG30_08820, partial [Ktedonobacterales bacterium]